MFGSVAAVRADPGQDPEPMARKAHGAAAFVYWRKVWEDRLPVSSIIGGVWGYTPRKNADAY